jgi:hypothetical protein
MAKEEDMEKQIVWTVSKGKYNLIMTATGNADEKDKRIELPAISLFSEMTKLSIKYNNKGYAVLFDAE